MVLVVLVAIAVAVSTWARIGIAREQMIAAVRAILQLAVVSLVIAAVLASVGWSIAFVALMFVVRWLDTLAWPLWLTCVVIFVVAWIGQFIGHSIEGKRPSFFKDVQFLLIGPIWLVSHVYRRLGLSF